MYFLLVIVSLVVSTGEIDCLPPKWQNDLSCVEWDGKLLANFDIVFRRRSKSKKSQKDAASASAAVTAPVPDVSLEQVLPQVAVTDSLSSGQSLLLPVKQEPCCESGIVPDNGMQFMFCMLK